MILDLGHVTFGNVSDWSVEEKGLEIGAQLPKVDEDDDGVCLQPWSHSEHLVSGTSGSGNETNIL